LRLLQNREATSLQQDHTARISANGNAPPGAEQAKESAPQVVTPPNVSAPQVPFPFDGSAPQSGPPTGGISPESAVREVSPRVEPEPMHPLRGFCCGVMPSTSRPVKMTGDKPADFAQIIKESSFAWVNFTVEDFGPEAENLTAEFGFSVAAMRGLLSLNRENGILSSYEDLDTEMVLLLPAVKVEKLNVSVFPVLVFVKRGLILTIHTKAVARFMRFARYADTIMRKIPQALTIVDKVTILLDRIISENNERNFDGLRSIEEHGDEMSKMLLDPSTPRSALGPEIYKMKHALITYLNTLWATMDVVNFMRYGDPEVITDNAKILVRFSVMAEEVNNQISLTEHMSEVLASGLEVLQSIYNNQLQVLNNKLAYAVAWLTILGTALLVPNTIATVMSNSVFNLTAADAGWYTVLIIASTVISTLAAFWFVHKSGWMPRKVD
jgi:magnesium transporter